MLSIEEAVYLASQEKAAISVKRGPRAIQMKGSKSGNGGCRNMSEEALQQDEWLSEELDRLRESMAKEEGSVK